MIIVVSRDQAGLYRSLRESQEANGRDRMILDRRVAERRVRQRPRGRPDRRVQDRRAPVSDAERALMSVLGFTVVQRDEGIRPAERPTTRGVKPAPGGPAARPIERQRTAGVAPGELTPRAAPRRAARPA
jgi:hypothetical protein